MFYIWEAAAAGNLKPFIIAVMLLVISAQVFTFSAITVFHSTRWNRLLLNISIALIALTFLLMCSVILVVAL